MSVDIALRIFIQIQQKLMKMFGEQNVISQQLVVGMKIKRNVDFWEYLVMKEANQ